MRLRKIYYDSNGGIAGNGKDFNPKECIWYFLLFFLKLRTNFLPSFNDRNCNVDDRLHALNSCFQMKIRVMRAAPCQVVPFYRASASSLSNATRSRGSIGTLAIPIHPVETIDRPTKREGHRFPFSVFEPRNDDRAFREARGS